MALCQSLMLMKISQILQLGSKLALTIEIDEYEQESKNWLMCLFKVSKNNACSSELEDILQM